MVRDGLAACHQLTALTLESTPLEELAALLHALPPSVRLLTIRHPRAGLLRSEVLFQCVSNGGLRHVQRLWIRSSLTERYDARELAEWYVRMLWCAPWTSPKVELSDGRTLQWQGFLPAIAAAPANAPSDC
jgi:hypothetical protein